MELAQLRNPRDSEDDDVLFEGTRNPGWEPDAKIMLQLELGQKISIFNTILPFINIVLLLQLYNSHPGSTAKSLFLGLTITLFVSAATIFWVYHSIERIQYSLRPNLTATSIIFFLTGSLAVFYYGLFIRLMFYKDEHEAYLRGQLASPQIWKQFYGEHTFEQEMMIQNSKLNWSIPSCFLLSVCLTYIAVITRKVYLTFSMRSYGLNKLLLIICSLWTIYVCWNMYSWASEANYVSSNMLLGLNLKRPAIGFMSVTFIVILLVTANTVLAIKKHKRSYITFTIVYACLYLVVMVFTLSTINYLSHFHRNQGEFMQNCKDVAVSVHEDKLLSVCPFGSKYLAPGVKCGKQELTIRWEAGLEKHQLRTLNPSCCEMSKFFYINAHTQLAHFGVMLSVMLVVLVLVNYSLWKNSNSLFYIFPKAWETVGGIVIVGACIAFILYLFFRQSEVKQNPHNRELLSYSSPMMFPSADFTLVPPGLSERTKGQLCHQYRPSIYPFPSVERFEAKKPILRVAMMGVAGYLKIFSDKVTAGPKNSRDLFFPGCANEIKLLGLSSFKVIYGPADEVKDAISQSVFCTNQDLKDHAKLFYAFSYWHADELDQNGLTHAENKLLGDSTNLQARNSASQCLLSHKYFFPAKFGIATSLKGKLVYKDPITGKESGVHPQIQVTVSEVLPNNQTVKIQQANTVILEDSIFIVSNIIRLFDFDSTVRLDFYDPTEVFLNKSVEVFLPKSESGAIELSAGVIRMITPDGRVCAPQDAVCKMQRLSLTGYLTINFTEPTVQRKSNLGAQIMVFKGFSFLSPPVIKSFGAQQTWKSDLLDYGAYTIVVAKKGYIPSVERVDLQSTEQNAVRIHLKKSYGDHQMTILSDVFDEGVDLDLLLVLKSIQGRECTVSPYNKYCAYAKMFSKDVHTKHRKDAVIIKNFAIATYTAYVVPAPAYSRTCKSDVFALASGVSIASEDKVPTWDWEAVKVTKPLSSIPVLAQLKHNNDLDPNDPKFTSKLLAYIPQEEPVETLQQTKHARVIRSSYPQAMKKSSPLSAYLVDTDIRYTLKKHGLLTKKKLRNWNPVATGSLNANKEVWDNYNFRKIIDENSLNNQTMWPEIDTRVVAYQELAKTNNGVPNKLEYQQNLPNGQKSNITETDTSIPAGNWSKFVHQGHSISNQTHFANNTTYEEMKWWSAEQDPVQKRVVSNLTEWNLKIILPSGVIENKRIYKGYERLVPEQGKQEFLEANFKKSGNHSVQTSVSKIFEDNTQLGMKKRTLITCSEENQAALLLKKSCDTRVHNSSAYSEFDSLMTNSGSLTKNTSLFQSKETLKKEPIVLEIDINKFSELYPSGLLNQTLKSRDIEFDLKKKKNVKLHDQLMEALSNDKTGESQTTARENYRIESAQQKYRREKDQVTVTTDHGMRSDTVLTFRERQILEGGHVLITTDVKSRNTVSPTTEFNTTNRTIFNRDSLKRLSMREASSRNESLDKYAGFKQDYFMSADTVKTKSGIGQYVSVKHEKIFQAFHPGTNVTSKISNLTSIRKTTHKSGTAEVKFDKFELNRTRLVPAVVGPINSTIIEKYDQLPWNRVETKVQGKKVCPQAKTTCAIEVKGYNQNMTVDSKYSSADLVMTRSLNTKGNRVLSQSLVIKHGNDTKRMSWDFHSLLDTISDQRQQLVQSLLKVEANFRLPANGTLAQLIPNNFTNASYFYGDSSKYRTHSFSKKKFFRKYTHSATKATSKSVEFTADSVGKVGDDLYTNKLNYSYGQDLLLNGNLEVNYSLNNQTKGKSSDDFFLDNFNLTGTKLESLFQIHSNHSNFTYGRSKSKGYSNSMNYVNSTKIEGHAIISKIETSETVEGSDNAMLLRQSRSIRKSIAYKVNNHQSDVLTSYIMERNKLNDTYHYEYKVEVYNTDLNRQAADPGYKKLISTYEKSFLILPSGKTEVLREHVFPEDNKRSLPELPALPAILAPHDLVIHLPVAVSSFSIGIFDIDQSDLSLFKDKAKLGLRTAATKRGRRTAPSHLRTPQAAADARLRKIIRKRRIPAPTFSKNSVDAVFGVDRSRYFLIACFTGFGAPSVLQLNEYTVERPTPDKCADRMSATQLKRYSVSNLAKEVREYAAGHLDYVEQLQDASENILEADTQDELEIADYNVDSFA